jgi:hypothetical protein
MKRIVCPWVLMGALLLPPSARAADNLDKSYDWTRGDVAAMRVADLIRMRPEMSSVPVMATYDGGTKLITLSIAGSKSTVDPAKQSLDKLLKIMASDVFPAIKKSMGVELTDADFILVYLFRKQGREVVRRQGGKYLVP